MIAHRGLSMIITYLYSLGLLSTAMVMNNAKKIGFPNKILNLLLSMDLDPMEVAHTIKVALD